ncbi:MAG: hypothetical protein KF846_03470 [Cyclobacteriaceae bacterium]|nr:hypothetical protein [Cyclobacteriaceae bacterium]
MTKKLIPLVMIGLALSLSKCSDEESPRYPAEPYIEFISAKFTEIPDVTEPDKIDVTFYYRDGDSDLGLAYSTEYTSDPFHFTSFFRKSDGSPLHADITLSGEYPFDDLIQFTDRESPPFDTIPSTNQYDCRYWYYHEGKYLYHQRNENYFNLIVKFLYSNDGLNFTEFDWRELVCHDFNARFPDLSGARKNSSISSGPFNIQLKNNLEGKITYTMLSTGFKALFGGKKLKLSIQVKDRALNRSNIIETDVLEP